jgi:hypothetical protein
MYTFHYTEEPAPKEDRRVEVGYRTDSVTQHYKSTGKKTYSMRRQSHKLAVQALASAQNTSFYVLQTP